MANKKLKTHKGELDKVQQEAFDRLVDYLYKEDLQELSRKSGVSYWTLRNWSEGITVSPRFITMCKVAKALGLEIRIVPLGKPALKRVK